MVYCYFDFNALPLDIQDTAKEFGKVIPLDISKKCLNIFEI